MDAVVGLLRNTEEVKRDDIEVSPNFDY